MATETKRTRRINIRLSEDIVTRLDAIAEQMGLATSTVASYAIGDFVNAKEAQRKTQQMAIMASAKQIGSTFESLFADPERLAVFAGAMGLTEDQLELPELGEKEQQLT